MPESSISTLVAPCPECGKEYEIQLTKGNPVFEILKNQNVTLLDKVLKTGDYLSDLIPDGKYLTEDPCLWPCTPIDRFNPRCFYILIEKGRFQGLELEPDF
jgi:hypothetical protein